MITVHRKLSFTLPSPLSSTLFPLREGGERGGKIEGEREETRKSIEGRIDLLGERVEESLLLYLLHFPLSLLPRATSL